MVEEEGEDSIEDTIMNVAKTEISMKVEETVASKDKIQGLIEEIGIIIITTETTTEGDKIITDKKTITEIEMDNNKEEKMDKDLRETEDNTI